MYGLSAKQENPSVSGPVGERQQEVFSPKVMDLSMEELMQANRVLNRSDTLHHIINLNNMISNGYRLNQFEQKLLDDFIANYTVQYKSPLAETLKED